MSFKKTNKQKNKQELIMQVMNKIVINKKSTTNNNNKSVKFLKIVYIIKNCKERTGSWHDCDTRQIIREWTE